MIEITTDREELGSAGFERYNKSRGGLTHDGKPIPGWKEIREEIREGWRVNAEAVLAKVHGEPEAMNFAGAMAHLLAGSPVARKGWVHSHALYFRPWDKRCPIREPGTHVQGKEPRAWRPDTGELLATDWTVMPFEPGDITRIVKVEMLGAMELWSVKVQWGDTLDSQGDMTLAYSTLGDYIGDGDTARRLFDRGIAPELRDGEHAVCSVGFCEREQRWYGWSHRAINGYGVGSVAEEGDGCTEAGVTAEYAAAHPEAVIAVPVGFVAADLGDARRMACAFAESVS